MSEPTHVVTGQELETLGLLRRDQDRCHLLAMICFGTAVGLITAAFVRGFPGLRVVTAAGLLVSLGWVCVVFQRRSSDRLRRLIATIRGRNSVPRETGTS